MWSRWSPHLSYELLLLLIFSFPRPHYLPTFTGIPRPLIYFHTCFSSRLDSSLLESRGVPIFNPPQNFAQHCTLCRGSGNADLLLAHHLSKDTVCFSSDSEPHTDHPPGNFTPAPALLLTLVRKLP